MPENLYTPNCIRTKSGRYVNVVDPDPATFHLPDIAHALSRIPRFGGHLPQFYSVAQHSLEVTRRVPAEHKLAALLHDASEAYLLDIPKPLKDVLPEYQVIEHRFMQRLAAHFGFAYPLPEEVKQADTLMLELEWKQLMLGDRSTTNYQLHYKATDIVQREFMAAYAQHAPKTKQPTTP